MSSGISRWSDGWRRHGFFPDTYLQGVGLTPFKIWSEYGICLILAVAALLLFRQRDRFEPGVLKLLIASIGVTVASELAFTLYVDVYGLFNLIGHFLKVISFYLIYRAIIQTGLNKPYDLVFRELKQGQEALATSMADLQKSSAETNALLAASRRAGLMSATAAISKSPGSLQRSL